MNETFENIDAENVRQNETIKGLKSALNENDAQLRSIANKNVESINGLKNRTSIIERVNSQQSNDIEANANEVAQNIKTNTA